MFFPFRAWMARLFTNRNASQVQSPSRQRCRVRLSLQNLEERINPVVFGSPYGPAAFASNPSVITAGNIFGNGYNDLVVATASNGVGHLRERWTRAVHRNRKRCPQ